jgi:hypothetical protein
MKKLAGMLAVAGVMSLAGFVQAGPEWEIGDDSWLKLSFLGQVHGTYIKDAEQETDIYLRRARIILAGQIMDGVKFFAETDNDNAGRNGFPDSSTDIQDIFVDVRILDSAHWAKAGLILLPFSFETRSSAASLLGIDYNVEAIKLVNTFVWRDYGAELHGEFLSKRLAYAVGVFDGYDSEGGHKSTDAEARITGHVLFNLIGEAETGWFYSQERLGAKGNYLTVGTGYDSQNKATEVAGVDGEASQLVDSEAWVLDFQSGFNFGEKVDLTVNGAWYDWDNAVFKGNTAFVEAGVGYGKTMLTGKYSLQDRDSKDSVNNYTAGIHYFMKNHNLRGGVEYRWGDSPDVVLAGLQFFL